MAEVLLFHHVLGRTRGMMGLRDQLQVGGNRVYVPDLFEGHVFTDRREGRAYVQQIGVDTILERARRAAEKLPRQLVFAGVSMGALAAYELTRSREGAVAALIISAAFEPVDLQSWPEAVPAQIHVMEDDPLLTPGDTAAMRTVAASKPGIQLFSYPGSTHLFTEPLSSDYDPVAARLAVDRARSFLAGVGSPQQPGQTGLDPSAEQP